MDYILTLVSAKKGKLTSAIVKKYTDIVSGDLQWLSKDQAVDILFSADDQPDIPDTIGIDTFIQPVSGNRKKKLLIADMDSTILEHETQDVLAKYLNVEERVSDITRRSMAGEINFSQAFTETVGLLKGLPLQTITDMMPTLPVTSGSDTLIKTMKANGAVCILASGGYTLVTGYIAQKLGFDHHFGNTLHTEDNHLTGAIIHPILDCDAKRRILEEQSQKYNIDLNDTMAVGDGANDIAMLQAAGFGISFHGKPRVVKATKHHIKYGDMTALLYMQGYSREELY